MICGFMSVPQNYAGKITARIVSEKGKVLAAHTFQVQKNGQWQELKAVLQPKSTDYKATLQLVFAEAGDIYVDFVSLFPQRTFMGRKNGMRPDVAQMIADLKPGFVRWPGGCIVEGATLEKPGQMERDTGRSDEASQ
mgnify:CR=1 FL=1